MSPRRAFTAAVAASAALVLGGTLLFASGEAGTDGLATAKRTLAPEPVVVNFWASWGVPCRKEAPELARFDREMDAQAQLVGVDFQDSDRDVRAFVREFRWQFPNVRDARGKLAGRYGVTGLPTTFVIDGEGRIARVLVGAQIYDELVAAVEEVE